MPPLPDTLVTVPVVLLVPAPIAVLKLAASRAETVLSALTLRNVMALGLVRVNRLPPTVVAPRLVRAPAAVDEPVPPLATGTLATVPSTPAAVLVTIPAVLRPLKVIVPELVIAVAFWIALPELMTVVAPT
ncbi:hypothetical protein H6795_02355 [Candidatus Nomurabacteria bacterium]|nr:hypothetical protein [Candidatus Nomurabacteria bacterium]